MQDSHVRESHLLVTKLNTFKEASNFKKKISTLKKYLDASEAHIKELESRVGKQERENDSQNSSLAHAQDDAIETWKASSELAKNMNA